MKLYGAPVVQDEFRALGPTEPIPPAPSISKVRCAGQGLTASRSQSGVCHCAPQAKTI
jgi:hypothetical protein